jgi:hypothetical protein
MNRNPLSLTAILSALSMTMLLSCSSNNQKIIELPLPEGNGHTNASKLTADISKQLSENNNQQKIVKLTKGQYHFYSDGAAERTYYVSNHDQVNPKYVGLALENLKNVIIDGQGAELIFHNRMMPVALINCENVTLRNFSIDYEPPHLRQLTVREIEKEKNRIICEIYPDGNYSIENSKIVLTGPDYKLNPIAVMPFDSTGKLSYMRGDLDFSQATVEEIEPNRLIVNNFQINESSKGDRYVLRSYYRPNAGIFISKCKNTTIENVTVHYAEGMALLAQLSDNIHLDGFSVSLKKDDQRVYTTQADATHFSGCKGVIISENGLYEGMADDAINVHGTYLKMMKKIDDKTVVGRYMHGQSWGFTWGEPGDTIQLVNSPVMEVVQSFNRIKSIEPVGTATDDGAKEFKIEFENPIPETITDESSIGIENLTWTPEVIFRNNTVRHNRARGALFSTPKKVVCENNLFDHTHGSAILLCGDCNGWYETGACRNVIIRNNKFVNALTANYQFTNAVISIYPEIPNLKDQQQYFHSGIVIENNSFEMFDRPLVYAKSVDGLTFRNNTINYNNEFEPFHWNKHTFFFEHVKNIVIENNKTVKPFNRENDIRITYSDENAVELID